MRIFLFILSERKKNAKIDKKMKHRQEKEAKTRKGSKDKTKDQV